jgi:hypothetical protein
MNSTMVEVFALDFYPGLFIYLQWAILLKQRNGYWISNSPQFSGEFHLARYVSATHEKKF